MRILYGSSVLATDGDLLAPAGALRLNGRQLVDEVALFRAVAAAIHARGNRAHTLQLPTVRVFSTLREAQVFALTHWGTLPDSGALQLTCGRGASITLVTATGAALADIAFDPRGLSVRVDYTFRCATFATEEPEIDPAALDEVMKRGTVSLSSGAYNGSVTFGTAFGAGPVVPKPNVVGPDGTAADIGVLVHSVTAAGFAYELAMPTPSSGYTLHWAAIAA